MAWSTHGYWLGTDPPTKPEPPRARCGGPGICSVCSKEAAVYDHEHAHGGAQAHATLHHLHSHGPHSHSHSPGCLGWWTLTRHYVQLSNEDPLSENMERRGLLYAVMGCVVGLIAGRLSVDQDEEAARRRQAQLDQLVAVQQRGGQLHCVWHAEPDAVVQEMFGTAWQVLTDVGLGHVHHQWTSCC